MDKSDHNVSDALPAATVRAGPWAIVGEFHRGHEPGWLHRFVPGDRFKFAPVYCDYKPPASGWHLRRSANAGMDEWSVCWRQAGDAWAMNPAGAVTIFPQRAATVGARKRLLRKDAPVLAWCFNVGQLYPGAKAAVARWALSSVDRFVVHSRRERETVSRWLKLPESRFEFVPLQSAPIRVSTAEDLDTPFVLAMGSAHRDYASLLQAVERLNVRTIIVASPRALEGHRIPPNVEVRAGLSLHQCRELANQARLSVVPLVETEIAAGQVTVLDSMNLGKPVIATRCTGTEDYIEHGRTGLLVPPGSPDRLAEAIADMWKDETLRRKLGVEAAAFVRRELSDEVAGAALGRILTELSK